jgi:hypothetical protein
MTRPDPKSAPAPPPERPLGCVGALGLVAFGLVLGLVVVEIALHLLVPIEPVFVKWDPVLGVRHRPGMRAKWYRETSKPVWVQLNKFGFRSPPVTPEKPAGTFRIMMLGDSYLEGMQVPMEQVVSERLRACLERRLPGRRVEVINAGNMGWGQAEQSLFLNREGWRFSPDLVVAFLYLGNDLTDNWYRTGSRVRPSYEVRGDSLVLHPPYLPAWKILLRDHVLAHLAIPKFVRMYMLPRFPWAKRWAAEQGLVLRDLGHARSRADQDSMLDVTRRLFDRMRADCDRHGARFVVFQFPPGLVLVSGYADTTRIPAKMRHDAPGATWEFPRYREEMLGYYRRAGLDYVDAEPGFREAVARGDSLYIYFEGHFTARGHEVAAEMLCDHLLAEGLVPGAPAPAR